MWKSSVVGIDSVNVFIAFHLMAIKIRRMGHSEISEIYITILNTIRKPDNLLAKKMTVLDVIFPLV
jgi:hypothetical protein